MAGGEDAPGGARRRTWARRFGWLVVLWAGGVVTVGVAAYALRSVMRWVGLSG